MLPHYYYICFRINGNNADEIIQLPVSHAIQSSWQCNTALSPNFVSINPRRCDIHNRLIRLFFQIRNPISRSKGHALARHDFTYTRGLNVSALHFFFFLIVYPELPLNKICLVLSYKWINIFFVFFVFFKEKVKKSHSGYALNFYIYRLNGE